MSLLYKFRFAPLFSAIAVFILGFYYSVGKAGIPYQDPTPAMAEEYMSYLRLGNTLMLTGFIILVASVIFLIVLKLLKNKKAGNAVN